MVPGRNSVTGRVRRRMGKSGKRRFPGGLHTDPHRPKRCGRGNGYGGLSDDEVELRQFLQRGGDETEVHEDAEVEEVFVCLYDEIVELS